MVILAIGHSRERGFATMTYTNIAVDVWRTAWAEVVDAVENGGSSQGFVGANRPSRSYWLVSGRTVVSLKCVARHAYSLCQIGWDRPSSEELFGHLKNHDFPVVHDPELVEGCCVEQNAEILGHQRPDYETYRRLARDKQTAFHALVMKQARGKCELSGCTFEPVLEACHIVPHCDGGPATAGNGVMLRADLHRLFDDGYIWVNCNTRCWEAHSKLTGEYQDLVRKCTTQAFAEHDERLCQFEKHRQATR